ncbi:MAG: hypothetical protein ACI4XL_07430 [Bacillus sp. (in: firmicutes)]
MTKAIEDKPTKVLFFFWAAVIAWTKVERGNNIKMNKPVRKNTIHIKLDEQTKKDKHAGQKASVYITKQESKTAKVLEGERSQKREEFQWVVPEPMTEEPPVHHVTFVAEQEEPGLYISPSEKKKVWSKQKRRNQKHITQTLTAVIIAVLVGLGFTYIVLQITTAEKEAESNSAVPAVSDAAGEGNQTSATAANSKPITISIVQGGVFSSLAAAEEGQQKIKGEGKPATVLSIDGSFYIALFVSDSIDSAKQISGFYREEGMDSYWKELSIAGYAANLSEHDAGILNKTMSLYNEMATYSSGLMLGNREMDEWEQFKEKADSLMPETIKDPGLKKMVETLSKAALQKKGTDEKGLSLSIQQELLVFVSLMTSNSVE